MPDEISSKMSKLSPAARSKIETALRSAIDAELASDANPAARDFSRGIIFSKVVGARDLEDMVIRHAAEMDDASFSKFTERLKSLQTSKGKG